MIIWEESIYQEKHYSERRSLLHKDHNDHPSAIGAGPEMVADEVDSEVATTGLVAIEVALIVDSKAEVLETAKKRLKQLYKKRDKIPLFI